MKQAAFELFEQLGPFIPFGLIVLNDCNQNIYMNDAAAVLLSNPTDHKTLPEENVFHLLEELYSNEQFQYCQRQILPILQKVSIDHINYDLFYLLDVTERAKQDEIMYLYETALNTLPTYASMICDKDGTVLMYNELSSMYDGLPRRYVIGKHISCITNDLEHDPLMKSLETGKPYVDHKFSYTAHTGNTINAIGTTFPIFKNNVLVGAYGLYRHQNKFNSIISEILEIQSISNARSKENFNGTRYTFESIIGSSPRLLDAKQKSKRAALSYVPVLLYGETGTGKELFAQSIHNAGYHADEPFVAVNCAAIPESLLESTLFGTTKGAFTGSNNTPGLFEAAQNGTLFLDEINSMPMQLQPKLLRVIQEKTVRRLGSTNEIPINCRIITSCNQPPMECLEKKLLRSDLFFRISTITIDIPPLRSRENDIIQLSQHFIQHFSAITSLPDVRLSEEVKELFLSYPWPGNVRELQHTIESTLVLSEPGQEITTEALPAHFQREPKKNQKSWPSQMATELHYPAGQTSVNLKEQLMEFEKNAILQSLKENRYNLSKTAKQLGYTRSNLQYRIKILGIQY